MKTREITIRTMSPATNKIMWAAIHPKIDSTMRVGSS